MFFIYQISANAVLAADVSGWDKTAAVSSVIGAVIVCVLFFVPIIAFLWRHRWKLLFTKPNVSFAVGDGYCMEYACEPPGAEVFAHSKTIVVQEPSSYVVLVRIDYARISQSHGAYFAVRFVQRRFLRKSVFPLQTQIAVLDGKGFQAHNRAWPVQSTRMPEGEISGINRPSLRTREKFCFIRLEVAALTTWSGDLQFDFRAGPHGRQMVNRPFEVTLDPTA